jgi:hypothetical protein
MTEWSKDHMTAIGSKKFNCGLSSGAWLKWTPGGATRGKGRQLVGKVGEWIYGELAPSRL